MVYLIQIFGIKHNENPGNICFFFFCIMCMGVTKM